MTTVSDLIASTHAAVYTYGVVAAFAKDKGAALNNQATYRRMRDQLIAIAEANGNDIPSAAAAYDLPTRITSDTKARSVAADLENAMCSQWADALAYDKQLRIENFLLIPSDAALRAYSWSGISYAFPN